MPRVAAQHRDCAMQISLLCVLCDYCTWYNRLGTENMDLENTLTTYPSYVRSKMRAQ
jgi:hypothetical protein